MAIYKTYQEAVIANGSVKGVHTDGFSFIVGNEPVDVPVTNCNPSDYLETLADFHAQGLELVNGDVYTAPSGGVITISCTALLDFIANSRNDDNERYIIQAAAYDNIETPEEKEAFETMTDTSPQQSESLGEVEWAGEGLPPIGTECVFTPDNTKWGFNYVEPFEGVVLHYEGEQFVFMLKHEQYNLDGDMVVVSRTDKGEFRKPETPEQREERERLEAAYDLYCTHELVDGDRPYDFECWRTLDKTVRRYLALVDKTGYRKETK